MKNIAKQKPSDLTPRLKAVIKTIDVNNIKGKRVLDIGCGYGWFEKFALDNKVKDIIGTEISDKDLDTARKYIKNKNAKFIVASAIDLPFKDGEFDTVVSWEVLEHIPKGTEVKMFNEIHRVLRKGGVLYLSTPFASWRSKIFDPAWWLIGHRHYSENNIKRYCKKSKFRINKIVVRGRWLSIISAIDMYISKWILRREPVFEDLLKNKVEDEYLQENGFKNIYIKINSK